jgi:glutathione S-transferase/alpha,alpha-trehalase
MPSHPDNPHPFGQVPALQDDDGVVEVWESGAILLYLADR